MKTLFLGALLSCFCPLMALAQQALPYKEAKTKAQEEKKPLVILCTGSDWLPLAKDIDKAFKALQEKSASSKDLVIWAIYDEKEKATPEELKDPTPPIGVWNYPALEIVDDQNRPLAFEEGLSASQISQALPFIEKALQTQKKRDDAWTEAQKVKGEKAAELIAKGLDAMPEKIARQYKNEIESLKKEDPEDKKGYHLKYTFGFLGFMEGEVNKSLSEQTGAEAMKRIDEKLKKPALTASQKQALWAGKFRIAKEMKELPTGIEYLKKLIDVDPKTPYANGARNLIAYYTQPVKIDGMSWTGRDNRPQWTSTSFNVASAVKSAGTYKIEFKHKSGHTRFKNPALKAGNRVLSQLTDDKESREFTISLPSGAPRAILEVQMMGTGWFDGAGDVIITKQ